MTKQEKFEMLDRIVVAENGEITKSYLVRMELQEFIKELKEKE